MVIRDAKSPPLDYILHRDEWTNDCAVIVRSAVSTNLILNEVGRAVFVYAKGGCADTLTKPMCAVHPVF